MKQIGKVTDKYFAKQWNLKMLNVKEAWSYTQGEGVVCAIIDSGVDGSHRDLGWTGINITALDSDAVVMRKYKPVMTAIASGAHPKILPGWNFVDDSPFTFDCYRHGTYLAGTIAAEKDGYGMVGVAPQAKIRPYVIINKHGRGNPATTAKAIYKAIADKVDVITLALQWAYPCDPLRDAIKEANAAGIIVVAASGNWNKDELAYPARYRTDLIAVGGCTSTGERWVHSPNRGSNWGDGLMFMCPGAAQTTTKRMRSRFAQPSGTSQACANFSGIACLFKAIDKNINRDKLVELLAGQSRPNALETGLGVPNVGAAVKEFSKQPDCPMKNIINALSATKQTLCGCQTELSKIVETLQVLSK